MTRNRLELGDFAAGPAALEVANLRYLTRGGQGLIYTGTHARGPCVVKILTPEAARFDYELVERFAREVRTLAQMDHPAVVQLWDSGTYERRPYAVLEAIEGRTLREVITSGPVRPARALEWIAQLLDVVQALHGQGIEHRDIKPSNVMLQTSRPGTPERVRLLDFGVVRVAKSREWSLTNTDHVVGTPRYFPPEIYEGEVDGPSVDLWATAVILYELVTPPNCIRQLRPGQVVRPEGAPTELQFLLHQLLAMDREHRPRSAWAMRNAIVSELRRIGA